MFIQRQIRALIAFLCFSLVCQGEEEAGKRLPNPDFSGCSSSTILPPRHRETAEGVIFNTVEDKETGRIQAQPRGTTVSLRNLRDEKMPARLTDANVLLGAKYTLEPKPNYRLTRDAGDLSDLTDGVLTHDSNLPMWHYRSCVGWQRPRKPVAITFDLKRLRPVSNLKIHLGGNANNVTWPKIVLLEGSSDGTSFHSIGSLNVLSKNIYPAPDAGYRRHVYDGHFDAIRLRYLRLRFIVGGLYLFADEAEAYGPEDSSEARAVESLPQAVSDDYLWRFSDRLIVRESVGARLKADAQILRQDLASLNCSAPEKTALQDELESILAEEIRLPKDLSDFKSTIPLTDNHRRMFSLHSKLLSLAGITKPRVSVAPYDAPVQPLERLPENAAPSLDLFMMNREYRCHAINIMNPTPRPLAFHIEVPGIPVTLMQVIFLDTNRGTISSTVMKPLQGPLLIPAGMTSQVVLRFHPVTLPPGIHHGQCRISHTHGCHTIPVNLLISRHDFPRKGSLSTGLYDYLDFNQRNFSWDLSRKDLATVLELQRSYGMNTTFASRSLGAIARPDKPQAGAMDFSAFDSWIEQWPEARQYVIYMGLHAHSKFGRLETDNPDFTKAVAQWTRSWEQHCNQRKLDPGRLVFYLIDEPQNEAMYRQTAKWLEAVRQGSAKIKTMVNPLRLVKQTEAMLKDADFVVPIFELLRDKGAVYGEKEIQVYNCKGGPFSVSPWYYRRQGWLAARHGATGSFFWSLGDCGGNRHGWNQYLTRNIYFSPLLLSDELPCVTKHLEAIREGNQDYEYVMMLKRLAPHTLDWRRAIDKLLQEKNPRNADRLRQKIMILLEKVKE